MRTNLRNEQIWLVVGSLMIVAVVALAVALIYTREVMIPFVLAIFITTMVSPVVDFQVVRWRVPGWIAIAVALLFVLILLALLGVVLIVAGQSLVHIAREYSERVADLTERVFAELHQRHIKVDQATVSSELEGRLPGLITSAAGTATTLMSHGFLIMIFVVFLLAGRNPYARRTGIYADVERTIRNYLATKTAISAITGVTVWLILTLLQLRMAPLFGMLAFLLNFIPNIGSIIATLLPIPIAMAQFGESWTALTCVVLPGAVHATVGNLIEPRLMGRGLEIHPVTVILSLAFWGLLWGIVGMVLAVPIVACLRIVLVRFSTTKPLGDLLAGHLPGTMQSAVAPTSPVKRHR